MKIVRASTPCSRRLGLDRALKRQHYGGELTSPQSCRSNIFNPVAFDTSRHNLACSYNHPEGATQQAQQEFFRQRIRWPPRTAPHACTTLRTKEWRHRQSRTGVERPSCARQSRVPNLASMATASRAAGPQGIRWRFVALNRLG